MQRARRESTCERTSERDAKLRIVVNADLESLITMLLFSDMPRHFEDPAGKTALAAKRFATVVNVLNVPD